jgi:hypothetical protein
MDNERPTGLHQDRVRQIYDFFHPDPESVVRQLEHLSSVTSDPLVTTVDAKQVGMIASMAVKVIYNLQTKLAQKEQP